MCTQHTVLLTFFVLLVLCQLALTASFEWKDQSGDEWSNASHWQLKQGSCGSLCYPGAAKSRSDLGELKTSGVTVKLTSGPILEPPDFEINAANGELILGLAGVSLGKGIITEGLLRVQENATVFSLQVLDGLTINNGKYLRSVGTVDISKNALSGSGTLDATGKNIFIRSSLTLQNMFLKGSTSIVRGTTTLHGGGIEGSLIVNSNRNFIYNGGSLSGSDITVSGSIEMKNSIESPSSTLVVHPSGSILFDSTNKELSQRFSKVTISKSNNNEKLVFPCTNDIRFLNDEHEYLRDIEIDGVSGCTVSLSLASLSNSVTVKNGTVLSLVPVSGSVTSTLADSVTIADSVLETNGQNLVIEDVLVIEKSSILRDSGGRSVPVKLQPNSIDADIQFLGDADLLVEYVVGTSSSGKVTIDNPLSTLTFSGSKQMLNAGVWNFDRCDSVNFKQPVDISGALNVKCNTEFYADTVVRGVLKLTDVSVSIHSGVAFQQLASGSLLLSNTNFIVNGNASLDSVGITNSNITIDSGQVAVFGTPSVNVARVTISGGTLDLSAIDSLNLQSNSILEWLSGNIISSKTNSIEATNSFISFAAAGKTFSGGISLDVGSTFSITASTTLGDGFLQVDGGSSVYVSGSAVTVGPLFPVEIIGGSTLIQDTSNFQIQGEFLVEEANWISNGASVRGDMTVISNANVTSDGILSVTPSGAIHILGASSWNHNSELRLNGILEVSSLGTVFTTKSVEFQTEAELLVEDFAVVDLQQPRFYAGSTFIARSNGVIEFSGENIVGSFLADGGTVKISGGTLGTVFSPANFTLDFEGKLIFEGTVTQQNVVFSSIASGGSDVNIADGSTLRWTAGTIFLDDISIIGEQGTLSVSGNSTIYIRNKKSIQVKNLSVAPNSSVWITSVSSLFVKNGAFSIGDPLILQAAGTLELSGCTNISYPSMEFYFRSKLNFYDGININTPMILDGSLTFANDSFLYAVGVNTVVQLNGPVLLDDSKIYVRQSSKLIANTNISIINDGEIALSSSAILELIGGNITVVFGSVTLESASLSVGSGNIRFLAGTTLEINDQSGVFQKVSNVSTGRIYMEDYSTLVIHDSPAVKHNELPFVLGNFTTVDRSNTGGTGGTIVFDNSRCTNQGGSNYYNQQVIVKKRACLLYAAHSSLIFDDSTLSIINNAYVEMSGGNFRMSGDTSELSLDRNGTLVFQEFSRSEFYSPVVISGTRGEHLVIDESILEIHDELTIADQSVVLIRNNAQVFSRSTTTIGANSVVDMDNSELSIIEPNDCYFSCDTSISLEGNWEATNSTINLGNLIEIIGQGHLKLATTTVNSSVNSGELYVVGVGKLTAEQSIIEIRDRFAALHSSEILLSDQSEFKIASGRSRLNNAATFTATTQSKVTFASTVEMNSQSSLTALAGSSVVLEDQADVLMFGTSQLKISGTDTTLAVTGGDLNLFTQSKVSVESGGKAVLLKSLSEATGALTMGDYTLVVVNAGTIEIQEGGVINGRDRSTLSITNNSTVSLDGAAIFSEFAELVMDASSFVISGELGLSDKSETTLTNNALLEIISFVNDPGLVTMTQSASLLNNRGNLRVNGSLIMTENSEVVGEGGNFDLVSGKWESHQFATLVLDSESRLLISGGKLNAIDNSTIRVIDSSIIIERDDMNLLGESTFTLQKTGDVLVSGGNAYFASSSVSDISDRSIFEVENGTSYCQNDAEVTFRSVSEFRVSSRDGFALFQDNCQLLGRTSALFITTGTTIFSQTASISLTTANFTVTGGDSLFMDHSRAFLSISSTFRVVGGNVQFVNDSVIQIVSFSRFEVIGAAYQKHNSQIKINHLLSEMDVDGVFQQNDNSSILLNPGQLTVAGSFSSRDEARVTAFSSNIVLQVGSTLDIVDNAAWFLNQGVFDMKGGTVTVAGQAVLQSLSSRSIFNGNIILTGDSTTTANSTIYDIDHGDFKANTNARMNIIESSTLSVLQGVVSFIDNSVLYIDGTSVFNMEDGNVTFSHSSNLITERGTIIEVEGGSLTFEGSRCLLFPNVEVIVSGDLIMRLDSCLRYVGSSIEVTSGNLEAVDNFRLVFEDSSINVDNGDAIFTGTVASSILFQDTSFRILSGDATFAAFTAPVFVNSSLSVADGGVQFWDHSNSTFISSVVNVEDILNDPIVTFSNSSISRFVDSEVHVVSAEVSFLQAARSTWENSTVVVRDADLNFIGFGSHLFTDSYVSVTGAGNALFDENVYAQFNNSDFIIDTEQSTVVFSRQIVAQFHHMLFDIQQGEVKLYNNSILSYTDSEYQIFRGTLLAADNSTFSLLRTPFTIQASPLGRLEAIDNAYLTFETSPIVMLGGDVKFSDNSVLEFADAGTTLSVVFGSLVFNDYSDFITVQGTEIDVVAGSFRVFDFVDISFDHVSLTVQGEFLLSNSSVLYALDSFYNVTGSFDVELNSRFTMESSQLDVSGTLQTRNNILFHAFLSTISVSGDVIFYGTTDSDYYFENSEVSVLNGGDLVVYENVTAQYRGSSVYVEGGFFEAHNSTRNMLYESTMSLAGDGTVLLYHNSYLALEQSSLLTVVSSGATATFADNTTVDLFELSRMSIEFGSVTFQDDTRLNLFDGTYLDISDGSLRLRNRAVMLAYPFTQGTITGGNFYITDDACAVFIESNINIVGSIEHNSTCPINFLGATVINITGTVEIGGVGVFQIQNGSFLHVQEGNLILRDEARLLSNDGRILVSGGSILTYDYSLIWADNTTDIIVEGGNITLSDESSAILSGQSSVLVTTTQDTRGAVYSQGHSNIHLTEASRLVVNEGNFEIRDHALIRVQEDSLIRVIGGDLSFFDYSTLDALPTSRMEVLADGNFYAGGAATFMSFCEATTLVSRGDMILAVRNSLRSKNSTFEISNTGNVIITDITRSVLEDTTMMDIFGGGNLELYRSAYLLLDSQSEIRVGDGGSALFGEDVVFDINDRSVLHVDQGNIEFYGDSELHATLNSIGEVSSGGSIFFSGNSMATLDGTSRLTVRDSGNIVFSGHTETQLTDYSFLLVRDGGDIRFTDHSELFSDHSFLTVAGGGNIILSGEGASRILHNSVFIVDGGNIEYRDDKMIYFDHSEFEIRAGNFLTNNNAVFDMIESNGQVSGGDFMLHDDSVVHMGNASIHISAGNVEMFDRGELAMNASAISVTGVDGLGGYFLLDHFVHFSMLDSSVDISGGDFESRGSVVTTLSDSVISVSSGSALFDEASQYQGTNSELHVSGGHLAIAGSSLWNGMDSLASVTGGNLSMSGDSATALTASMFDVSGGSITLLDQSTLQLIQSSLEVTGGDLAHQGGSYFDSHESTIDISNGRIIYDDNSVCDIQSTRITVALDDSIQTKASPIENDDLMIFGGSSYVHIFGSSVLTLLRGNFVFVESASGLMEDTSITISGGNMNYKGDSSVEFLRVDIRLLEGTILATETSSVSLRSSLVDISGGSFIVEAQSDFVMTESSSIQMNGGSALFSGGSSEFVDSILSVNENGSIHFIGNSQLSTTRATITLSGNGELLIADNASGTFTSSALHVTSGTLTIGGLSAVLFDESSFSISGGNTFFTGSAIIDILHSSMIVSDGDVYFTDSSQIIIHEGSTYSVTGGNVFTESSTQIDLTSDSCFVIEEGSVTYSEFSVVSLVSSCWNVTGGDSIFEENASFSLLDHSLLSVSAGSFMARGSINIEFETSGAFVTGGNFTVEGQSVISLRSMSFVEVQQGNAIFTGDIQTDVTDSSFIVSGGFVSFDGQSQLTWFNSLLAVSSGDMVTKGNSFISFDTSQIEVSGGGVRFLEHSIVSFVSSNILVSLGSVNFHGDSVVSVTQTPIRITHGDMQFGGDAEVSFLNSPIYISGQLEFVDRADILFDHSDITVVDGSFHSKDYTNIQFVSSSIDVGGSFTVQNDADVRMEDCWVAINDGDFRINDRGTFQVLRTSVKVIHGNFAVVNPSETRKYLTVHDSIITVHAADFGSSSSSLFGNMILSENVEMTLTASDVIIDGSLLLEGQASLYILDSSSFVIPTGVVQMDAEALVIVREDSVLLNQGQLVAPGEMNAPIDSSLTNEGLLESHHDMSVNCNMQEATAPLVNSGQFQMSPDSENAPVIQSCIQQLRHRGLMQFTRSNVTLGDIETSPDSIFTLSDAFVQVTNEEKLFPSYGSIGGSGEFVGSFNNYPSGVIMATGELGTSRIQVENEFSSSGTVFFVINSRDLSDTNTITRVSAGGIALDGGRACVCFSPSLEFEEGDRFDLMIAQSRLQGTFNQVEFDCLECPRRSAKSIAGNQEVCDPVADYGVASFSVLFATCGGGGGDGLDSISPPWYVILTVALAIILGVIIFFGGGLILEKKYRARQKRISAQKRHQQRLERFKESLMGSTPNL